MSAEEYIHSFSDYIFWDVDKDQIDLSSNAPFVVRRVLEYGQIDDWRLLLDYYGLRKIVEIAQGVRYLDPKALSFISTVSGTSKDQYRCYTTRNLGPIL